MKQFIQKLTEREHLTQEEAANAMRFIMDGEATDSQIAAFLIALKMKGEHPDELLGFVQVMREKSVKVRLDDPDAIDMCGTGGDNTGTFNISTVASFVVAGAGVTVAKHGNRSISSSCGSADVLKALGVNIELSPEKTEICINTIGVGFLFAPLFHPAMKHAAKPRAELGVKTCFNMLGPMTNPAGVKRQLVGTFSRRAAEAIASVYCQLDTVKVLIVHSHDGLDEVSLEGPTMVHDVDNSSRNGTYDVEPAAFGLSQVMKSSILGSSPEVNATLAMDVLSGTKGPHRDIVVANATMGLMSSGKVHAVTEGVKLAQEAIDSGRAMKKLVELKSFTNA